MIIEGVCLREIIVRLRIDTDFIRYVYVTRLSRDACSTWHNGVELEEFEDWNPASASILERHLSVFRYQQTFHAPSVKRTLSTSRIRSSANLKI